MSNKEKVIKLLINIYNETRSNPIKLSRTDIKTLDISEKEVIQILNTLNKDKLIITNPKSPNKDFSVFWEITISTECINYFANLKINERNDRRARIQTYAPIILSIIAIIISTIDLIIHFCEFIS